MFPNQGHILDDSHLMIMILILMNIVEPEAADAPR
jgi:hypothetical protein